MYYIIFYISMLVSIAVDAKVYQETDIPILFFSQGKVVINTSMPVNGDVHFFTDNNGFEHQAPKKVYFDVMKIPADVHVSGDGNTLYYLDYGYQPARIYRSQRLNKQWQSPIHLSQFEIAAGNAMLSTNSKGDIILSAGGELYQSKQDKIRKLSGDVNSPQGEFDPFISNKGDYLLFVREDAKGDTNIYIALKQGDSWTSVKRLPAPFNSQGVDGSPYVTADNKYLFVTSNRDGEKTATWQIPFLQFYLSLKE